MSTREAITVGEFCGFLAGYFIRGLIDAIVETVKWTKRKKST